MSYRQGGPVSDPATALSERIRAIGDTAKRAETCCTKRGLPNPLEWRITPITTGPPPTYQIEIVNPLSGGSINLGVI